MPTQIPLRFEFHAAQSFDHYHTGPNAEAVQRLRDCACGNGEELIFLWGTNGLGKTHLLQACSHLADQNHLSVLYLPLKTLCSRGPSILEDLETLQLLCIDDIDTIAGDDAWEHAFFNLFNRSREHGHRMIMTAPLPPLRLSIQLPDLLTRLGWGLTLHLQPPDDNDKLAALIQRASNLGFELSPRVGRFLLAHQPRDMPALWKLLDELDEATLSAQRRLTIPFLKSHLKKMP